MSARSLLRHVFRHEPRGKVSVDALPLGLRQTTAGNNKPEIATVEKKFRFTSTPVQKTPEPFGLEDITEEAPVDTPPSIETASPKESFTSLDLGISSYSTRDLVQATLDEAKATTDSHLDTINSTLALLDALDGFSETISELRKEMIAKKHVCEGKLCMLGAVERAVEDMVFAGEPLKQGF
ncbi:hypothetical protein SVAN01_00465 [Stagonosporopsis vannaccii]|nr:hypothetical protein SVAN01_00465 [Stagonosporopsis vannaccii]